MEISTELLRVLVIDDDHDHADSLRTLVKLWGHDVQAAYDGDSALQVARWFHPHVMLIDLAMPGMHGCDLARQLRRLEGMHAALMFAVTGYADEAHVKHASEVGFTDYLIKPVEPAFLERLLTMIDLSPDGPLQPEIKDAIERNRPH